MKAVIQRVSSAEITIDGEKGAKMATGLVVLLGVGENDEKKHADYLAEKISGMRIFSDAEEKMNLSIKDVNGEMLVVSNFTLHADCRKGKRPSFIKAAKPDIAESLYEYFVLRVGECSGCAIYTGKFGADMQISLVNDGPVTIITDTDYMMKQ